MSYSHQVKTLSSSLTLSSWLLTVCTIHLKILLGKHFLHEAKFSIPRTGEMSLYTSPCKRVVRAAAWAAWPAVSRLQGNLDNPSTKVSVYIYHCISYWKYHSCKSLDQVIFWVSIVIPKLTAKWVLCRICKLLHTSPDHFSNWSWEKPILTFLPIWRGPSQHVIGEGNTKPPKRMQNEFEMCITIQIFAGIRNSKQQQLIPQNPPRE